MIGLRKISRFLLILFAVLAVQAGLSGLPRAQEELQVLARVGPWPVVSRLVGFDGRVWFANSVKGVNHNSAELYSYDPAAGAHRYERHLFSQDAGRPLVHHGRLYWPFEDARISLGWGQVAITDGRTWHLATIPSARSFHTHDLAVLGDRLIAATSAWRAGFQVSNDNGITWREGYDHPTPEGRVSRITKLVAQEELVLGPLVMRDARRLLRFDGESVTEVPEWPKDQTVLDLVAWRGAAYGLVAEPGGTALWRTDGRRSERLAVAVGDWHPEALASDENALWSLSATRDGGVLHSSSDGLTWQPRHRVAGGRPLELLIDQGFPYVGGSGSDGQGILWGTRHPVSGQTALPSSTVRSEGRPGAAVDSPDWIELGARLDRMLEDPETYAGRTRLRDLVFEAARANPPPDFFGRRLEGPRPDRSLDLIGGATSATADQLSRWILLWGMAVAGQGRVPLAMISEPWSVPANRAEKYFGTAPAAIWAASWIGQRDRATIEALVGRLDREGDPDWLAGDLVGALTSLTGQPFGFDAAAWRRWWAEASEAWLY